MDFSLYESMISRYMGKITIIYYDFVSELLLMLIQRFILQSIQNNIIVG